MTDEGYEVIPFEEKADIYVINTCSVTENADKNDARSFTGLQEILNKPLKHCFVLSNDYQVKNFGENITAIEVKSTAENFRRSGIDVFVQKFKPQRVLLVGGQGIAIEKFLNTPITNFIN